MGLMLIVLLLNLSHVFCFLPTESVGKRPKDVVRDQEASTNPNIYCWTSISSVKYENS